jgi:flagellar M-ring protein FliF
VLVDAAGHLPLGPKTAEALRLGEEQALEEKLVSTLEPVTGAGNVRASVTIDYDAAATDETQETYDPDQTVTLSMQRTDQTAGPQQVAAGVPGTASNAPNTQALPVYPPQTSAPTSAKTESNTYGASKTVRHTQQNPGRVRRMTAAIVVNDRQTQLAVRGKAAVWQPRSAEELRNLTALAQAAIGFDTGRGDTVTVENMGFEDNRAAAAAPWYGQILATIENSPVLVKYTALMAGLLLVLAMGVRPALARVAKSGAIGARGGVRELAATAVSGHAALPIEPAAPDPEQLRAREIHEQVSRHLQREPSQSSRLLQSWIHSE